MHNLKHDPDDNEVEAYVKACQLGTVCKVCGLEALGHVPEGRRLGFNPHDYAPKAATKGDLSRAHKLTKDAYKARPRVS